MLLVPPPPSPPREAAEGASVRIWSMALFWRVILTHGLKDIAIILEGKAMSSVQKVTK
jgi:hypothetical protein